MSEQVNKLVPILRFPYFKDAGEWNSKQLGDVAKLIKEKAGSKSYTLMSVTAGVGLVTQIEKFGKEIAGEAYKNYYVIKKGDFAYNKSSTKLHPEGQMALLDNLDLAAVPNSIFTCFRVDEEFVSPYFLKYPFANNIHGKWLRNFISVGARANGALNVDSNDLLTLPIVFPSLKEQQKIADCLSSLDDLITVQNQKVEALKQHKKGLMQQLFPAEGETVPKLRFPEFEDAGGWQAIKFGEAATFINGKAYKQEELLDSGKYPVLRVGNFFTSNHWYYSNLELEQDKYCDNGDLLYAWSASFGPRIWSGDKSIYHYHIWKVLPKDGTNLNFLYILLDSETERMKSNSSNGLGLLHITKGTIEGWDSYMPSLPEQEQIAGFIMSIDDLIKLENEKLTSLKEHKKGLMQQLFPTQSNEVVSG